MFTWLHQSFQEILAQLEPCIAELPCLDEGDGNEPFAPDDAPSVSSHAALELDAAAFADVQARVRTRVLRTFVKRGLIWMHQ